MTQHPHCEGSGHVFGHMSGRRAEECDAQREGGSTQLGWEPDLIDRQASDPDSCLEPAPWTSVYVPGFCSYKGVIAAHDVAAADELDHLRAVLSRALVVAARSARFHLRLPNRH